MPNLSILGRCLRYLIETPTFCTVVFTRSCSALIFSASCARFTASRRLGVRPKLGALEIAGSLLTRSKVAAAADFSPTFVSRLRFSSAVLFSSFSMFAPIFSLPPGGAPGCDASILRPGPAAPLDCSIQACDTWPGGLPCIVLVVAERLQPIYKCAQRRGVERGSAYRL